MDNSVNDVNVKNYINNIFKNVFLIAVAKKLDLSEIVNFVENNMSKVTTDDAVDNKYLGVVFINLLAKEMNVSIGDLLNNEIEYQRTLVENIITFLSMEGTILDLDVGDDSEEDEAYITYVISKLQVFDKTAEFEYTGDTLDEEYVEEVTNDYIVELVRTGEEYSMSILTNNITSSDLFKGQVEVWRESEGLLADFIEEAFEENLSVAFKEGLSSQELIACVFDDTRTIALLDKFEGFGDKYEKSYHRLVIKNGMLYRNYGDPYIHLVIERRTDNNITGDITFTQFKQGEIRGLRQHIIEELDENIIDGYCDKNQFYKFKKKYLLRAQNSKNRSGYGWVWNWKNGVGTYVKGTEYGETTDYVFVGAYISKTFIFDSTIRSEMLQIAEFDGDYENVESNVVATNFDDKPSDTSDVQRQEVLENSCTSDVVTIIERTIGKEVSSSQIYDIDKLRTGGSGEAISIGSVVRYKKLHLNEEVEDTIGESKLLHKKMIGKKQGDIIPDGSKRYLIISINNSE